MKKILLLIAFVWLCIVAFAQIPMTKNFESLAQNTSRDPVIEQVNEIAIEDPQTIPGSIAMSLMANVTSDSGDTLKSVASTASQQIVQAPQGWSGLSSYLIPDDPNIVNLFQQVQDRLIILYNLNGVYYPAEQVNTLGDWDPNSGYIAKFNQEVNIDFSGQEIENLTLSLSFGWNLMPVLTHCPLDVEELFSGTELEMVKEVAGYQLYWPDMNIKSIDELLSGQAYFVLMNAPAQITFSACPVPNIFAGEDASICETDVHYLNQAFAENYCFVFWTTSGYGSFDDPTIVNTFYTPAPEDYGTTVTLCLTIFPIFDCYGEAITDCMDLFVQPLPIINAGDDQVICWDEIAYLNGNSDNFSNVYWSGGDGIFTDQQNLVTEYIPGENDIFSGYVEICLTAQPINPCYFDVVDCLILTFSYYPDVFAGDDQTICESEVFYTSPWLSNYSQIFWTTSGDGFFDNVIAENPVYNPGVFDILSGSVQLCVTTWGIVPCIIEVTDCIQLNIVQLPGVEAGADATISSTASYLTAPEVTNYSQIMWTTFGDGYFDDPFVEITNYYPGVQDINLINSLEI